MIEKEQIDMEKLTSIYYNARGKEPDGKSKIGDSYLYIDWRNQWSINFLNSISWNSDSGKRVAYILPPEIKGVGIGYLDQKWEAVKKFLTHWIQNELEWLWVNYIALDKWEKQYRLGVNEFIPSLVPAISKVTKWVGINYFKLDSYSFQTIIKGASKAEKLDLDNWSFKFDNEMDFGNQEYKIQIISMEDTFIRDLPSKMYSYFWYI